MDKMHIVDPDLVVLDEFGGGPAEADEEPEFIEFNKQQRQVIANALSGPPDQVGGKL